MPTAALRPCAGGCGQRVPKGRCPQCSRQVEQRRGSAASRGYGPLWRRFRMQFVYQLVGAGKDVICGATLPGGPQTHDSHCKALGLYTFESESTDLHFDHEPPLRDEERGDPHAVCNPLRIQLLCESCHNRKTKNDHTIN